MTPSNINIDKSYLPDNSTYLTENTTRSTQQQVWSTVPEYSDKHQVQNTESGRNPPSKFSSHPSTYPQSRKRATAVTTAPLVESGYYPSTNCDPGFLNSTQMRITRYDHPPRSQSGKRTAPSHCHDRILNQAPSSQSPLFRKIETSTSPNIVIFGQTGAGKSSLINMLSDVDIAPTSNRAVGCTFESTGYDVTIDGKEYTLWDTAGLNEGDAGSIPAEEAVHCLHELVEKLGNGISLLVYCIRGSRYQDIVKVNYDLFAEIMCQGEVPVVVVVTGLENEERMEDWWVTNKGEFISRNMCFSGHACITTSKGKKNIFEKEYEESKEVLRTLIKTHCSDAVWVVGSVVWFEQISARIGEYFDLYYGLLVPTMPQINEDRPPLPSLQVLFHKVLSFIFQLVN